jgi:hypothetical protein
MARWVNRHHKPEARSEPASQELAIDFNTAKTFGSRSPAAAVRRKSCPTTASAPLSLTWRPPPWWGNRRLTAGWGSISRHGKSPIATRLEAAPCSSRQPNSRCGQIAVDPLSLRSGGRPNELHSSGRFKRPVSFSPMWPPIEPNESPVSRFQRFWPLLPTNKWAPKPSRVEPGHRGEAPKRIGPRASQHELSSCCRDPSK